MNIGELLSQSSRVALAALLHDLGKFHERSGLPLPGDRAGLETLYRYSHAAHTGGIWDAANDCSNRSQIFPVPASS